MIPLLYIIIVCLIISCIFPPISRWLDKGIKEYKAVPRVEVYKGKKKIA